MQSIFPSTCADRIAADQEYPCGGTQAVDSILDGRFRAEAIRRAEAAGFFPAYFQRDVHWQMVQEWTDRCNEPGFVWKSADDRSVDAIIVGPGAQHGIVAIHAGQHRILAGLMASRPVPESSITTLTVCDRTRGWDARSEEVDVLEVLGFVNHGR
jgi:hypothetical protein